MTPAVLQILKYLIKSGGGSVLCIGLLEYVHIIITLIINAEGERGGGE